MAREVIIGPHCQSCSMPISKPEDFGSEANNVKRLDYCYYCYRKGAFVEPEITSGQMADRLASIMAERFRMPLDKAKEKAVSILSGLKRWRTPVKAE
ncbi:MAG: zinc ribbon domain-containing protein [Deltaproteobacteria bacterium]|nr:zinc ribbon domain-containing protein [Deltaproteobacteria bacterium]MBI5809586.1 zinc ribbon domain-containing protein [Deltaproteobacteria bacterium]